MKKFITAVTIVLMMSFGLTTFGCTVQDNTSSSSQQLHSTQSSQSLSTNSDSSVESSSSLSSSSQELSTTESSQSSTESLDSSVESSSSSSSILSSTSPSSSSSSSSQSSSSIKQFTIAFQNGEQTIWTTQVEQGQEVVYGGETPTKQADAQYTYEFIGWQTEDGFLVPTLLPAYQDMVYYAKYSHTLNSYKIILRDGENILKEDKLSYGEQIVYDGELTKPSTKEYEYNFVGWSLSENGEPVQLGVVTGEATYWAIYTQTARKYDIKFVIDGQEQVEKFGYGEDIIYSQTPVKQATEEYLYEFVGWSLTENGEIVQLGQVQGEQTYYAVFNPVKNRFTVSWNIDGKVSTNYVTKGSSPVYNGQTPTKGEVGKIYTFEGWSLTEGGEIVDLTTLQITQDETYYAIFSYEVETFTITWDVEGVLTTQTYNYGQTLFWDNQTPTKPSTLDIQFTFKGWSKTQNGEVLDLNEVMACNDMTLYAVFEGKIIEYNIIIKYQYLDGTTASADKIIKVEKGKTYGKTETLSPTISGYAPNRYWFSGIATKEEEIIVTYTQVSVWDGKMPTLESGATASTLFTGNGTKESPYLIQSATDLAKLSVLTAGLDYGATTEYFKLTTSIDLSIGGWLPICHRGVFTGTSWKYFSSNFDGDGHTIIFNETISGQGFGLFTGIKGTISNLVFSGSITANNRVGAVAYHGSTGTIENVYNYTTITTSGTSSVYVAGIVGTNGGKVENCVNYGDINCAGNIVAGITSANATDVSNCVNYGKITAGSTVGGITASNPASIINCTNYGDISAVQYVGGINGNTSSTTIDNCINYGNVIATSSAVGGISGQIASSSVAKLCVNYGNVSGVGNTGGISGYMGNGSHIYGCTNHGDVYSSGNDVGGIVGENKGDVNTITIDGTTYYNYNYGNVEGDGDNVGGITGYHAANTGVTNGAYNYGNVYGKGSYVGGIVGENAKGTVTNSENRGNVSSDTSYIGGGVGRNNGGTLENLTNYGVITANNRTSKIGTGVGGVVGSNQNTAIGKKLYNYGDVYGYTQVGGISGYQGAGSIIDVCENTGNVYSYGTGSAGTLVGANNGEVTNAIDGGTANVG